MLILWIIIALVVVALLWLVFTYNRLVRLRNESSQGFSGIDIQLKRRADLIPNLFESVKAYAAHEQGVFDEVTQARAHTLSAQGVNEALEAAGRTTARPSVTCTSSRLARPPSAAAPPASSRA